MPRRSQKTQSSFTPWRSHMCYGCLTVADIHIGWILDLIPFYYTLKLIAFIWLQLPVGAFLAALVGPAITRFIKNHTDEVYQLNWDKKKPLDQLKKTVIETGTEAMVEMAMERMAEEATAENSLEK